MLDKSSQMNPLYGVYSEFKNILDTLVIKYSYLAEKYETFEIKKAADLYISCVECTDTFYNYNQFTASELQSVGITDASKILLYTTDDGYLKIPKSYHDSLLKIKREAVINSYEERNDYYRELNGYPPLNTPSNKYHYITAEYAERYGIDQADINIPIHQLRDYYNNRTPGKGDYIISIIESSGLLTTLQSDNPDDKYLKYIGSSRIAIEVARKAKNFQLLYINESTKTNIILDEFIKAYEQARDYYVSAIFIREYRNIIPYYDQFIALNILCMTIEIVLNNQFKLGIDRKYYDEYTLRMLYDAYGIPYNMGVDNFIQMNISQSLNRLIQEKSTDSVFYDLTKLLGFDDLKLYKYYLSKSRKFDEYGVPIIASTTRFNSDTGEFETIPDYASMYDVYFQKVELSDKDFISSYTNTENIEDYTEITDNDPFWWNDENTFNAVWETDYNIVESKYLSVGISYKMTEIMYENILLLKLLIRTKDDLNTISFTLPKISGDTPVTLFDTIILLLCLMSKKHSLCGEIISIPSQILSVLDYLHDTDGTNYGEEYLVNSFDINLELFRSNNIEGQEMIAELYSVLDYEDANKLRSYIEQLTTDLNIEDKIIFINNIFSNIKNISKYLQYLMTKTSDRHTYDILKAFYNTAFYTKEVKSMFTINTQNSALKRTARNYFEFLYHHNPTLYLSLFTPNITEQYEAFISRYSILRDSYSEAMYKYDVEYGAPVKLEEIGYEISDNMREDIESYSYATLNANNVDTKATGDLLYYYIDHIISRMSLYIEDLKYIYMINDSLTPVEDLLIKLINFFKSFTVDMLGLDALYIINLRTENTIKFFDEASRIRKELLIKDNAKLSYNDMVYNSKECTVDDGITFKDRIFIKNL